MSQKKQQSRTHTAWLKEKFRSDTGAVKYTLMDFTVCARHMTLEFANSSKRQCDEAQHYHDSVIVLYAVCRKYFRANGLMKEMWRLICRQLWLLRETKMSLVDARIALRQWEEWVITDYRNLRMPSHMSKWLTGFGLE